MVYYLKLKNMAVGSVRICILKGRIRIRNTEIQINVQIKVVSTLIAPFRFQTSKF